MSHQGNTAHKRYINDSDNDNDSPPGQKKDFPSGPGTRVLNLHGADAVMFFSIVRALKDFNKDVDWEFVAHLTASGSAESAKRRFRQMSKKFNIETCTNAPSMKHRRALVAAAEAREEKEDEDMIYAEEAEDADVESFQKASAHVGYHAGSHDYAAAATHRPAAIHSFSSVGRDAAQPPQDHAGPDAYEARMGMVMHPGADDRSYQWQTGAGQSRGDRAQPRPQPPMDQYTQRSIQNVARGRYSDYEYMCENSDSGGDRGHGRGGYDPRRDGQAYERSGDIHHRPGDGFSQHRPSQGHAPYHGQMEDGDIAQAPVSPVAPMGVSRPGYLDPNAPLDPFEHGGPYQHSILPNEPSRVNRHRRQHSLHQAQATRRTAQSQAPGGQMDSSLPGLHRTAPDIQRMGQNEPIRRHTPPLDAPHVLDFRRPGATEQAVRPARLPGSGGQRQEPSASSAPRRMGQGAVPANNDSLSVATAWSPTPTPVPAHSGAAHDLARLPAQQSGGSGERPERPEPSVRSASSAPSAPSAPVSPMVPRPDQRAPEGTPLGAGGSQG